MEEKRQPLGHIEIFMTKSALSCIGSMKTLGFHISCQIMIETSISFVENTLNNGQIPYLLLHRNLNL